MKEDEKDPKKKVFSIIATVLTAIIAVAAVAAIINMIVCRVQKRPVSFFGTSFAIVQSDSMEPYIMTGDLIVFHSCKYEDVKVGDYIVFVAGDGFGQLKGQSIVHEAKAITESGIVTQGKNELTNLSPDKDLVTRDNLLGICTSNSAVWGRIFAFLAKYGIILLIAAIAVPVIVSQTIKIVKLSKEKNSPESAEQSTEEQSESAEQSCEEQPDCPPSDEEGENDVYKGDE